MDINGKWKIIHKDNNHHAMKSGAFTVRINDGFCEHEFNFQRDDGHYSISEIAKCIAAHFDADIVSHRLIKTLKINWE